VGLLMRGKQIFHVAIQLLQRGKELAGDVMTRLKNDESIWYS